MMVELIAADRSEIFMTLAEAEARAASLKGAGLIEIVDMDGETIAVYHSGRRIEQTDTVTSLGV